MSFKKERVDREHLLEPEGRDAGERLLRYHPTQPDLRLSFTDFFAQAHPTPQADPQSAVESVDEQHTRPPRAKLAAAPRKLCGLLRPMLMRLDGACAGELFSLENGSVVMGRGAECEIAVEDDGVSQRHASIFCSDGVWYVQDLGSSHGTLLNDRRVNDAQQLRDGAVVSLSPGVAFVFQRINARHEATLRQLFHGSNRDALTGVHNRRYVDERLCAEVAFAVRHQRPLSVVVLEIDRLRALGEQHGSEASELMSKRVTECIQPLLRVEDVFGRYGRDEFALVLRDTESFTAGAIAERLRNAVHETVGVLVQGGARTAISAGCASLAECTEPSPTCLMSLAKRRLSDAKTKGGNRVAIG